MGSSTNGTIRKHETWVPSVQRISDAVIIILAHLFARWLYAESWNEQVITVTVIGLLVYGFVAEIGGLYRPWRMETILR